MESCWDAPLQGVLPAAYPPEKFAPSTASKFEELFPGGSNMEEEDASQEWLSIFLEECLSNTTYCITTTSPSLPLPNQQASISPSCNPRHPNSQNPKSNLEQGLVYPTKASRTKRRRVTPGTTRPFANHTFHVTPPELPLLPQDCWLAESELIILKKEQKEEPAEATTVATSATAVPVEGWRKGGTKVGEKDGALTQPRKCSHCLSQKTPQWRAGPLGPKTLCNACGVRFKSGRLLPEYRPAKSPTFVSYKHSNSHKKVLEMRMSIVSSSSN
ncbi:hypothetical protein Taro_045113 [Colocasia esculenta]|uniref:GATA-type domain-containing protein n=1 Tax=Colocasia esculenta TaxID=4460 RepID=A0A843WZK3_COLES|nr:hypothetical protein [Colocasia esculenta]